MASQEYSEQVGRKRQDGGKRGEIKLLYALIKYMARFANENPFFISITQLLSAVPTSLPGLCGMSFQVFLF